MQVNQHKACGSLSHCDRTGEREENALPAIRVVLPDQVVLQSPSSDPWGWTRTGFIDSDRPKEK